MAGKLVLLFFFLASIAGQAQPLPFHKKKHKKFLITDSLRKKFGVLVDSLYKGKALHDSSVAANSRTTAIKPAVQLNMEAGTKKSGRPFFWIPTALALLILLFLFIRKKRKRQEE